MQFIPHLIIIILIITPIILRKKTYLYYYHDQLLQRVNEIGEIKKKNITPIMILPLRGNVDHII